jgi:tRNA 2-thiouridine synthesizing protein A
MPNMGTPFWYQYRKTAATSRAGLSHHRALRTGVRCLRRGYLQKEERALMKWDVEIDCIGLLCPLPVLRAQKALRAMRSGQVLRILATDAMAAIDLPHFCSETGHLFFKGQNLSEGSATEYFIRCK